MFTVITNNAFPITAFVQIYFMNEGYFALDSLFSMNENIIQSGVVGPAPDLKVVKPTYKKVETVLGRNKLDHLAATKKLIIRGTISSYQSGDVKFYNTDYIDIKVGVKTKLSADF